MNTARLNVTYGQRVTIARDRSIDNTRTDRLALLPDLQKPSRWGATAVPAVALSSSAGR